MNQSTNFWKKLFNQLEVGDRVRLVGKHPTVSYWVEVEKRWGVITDISRDNHGRVFYEVRFRKKDIPSMTEDEDYATFTREWLELIL